MEQGVLVFCAASEGVEFKTTTSIPQGAAASGLAQNQAKFQSVLNEFGSFKVGGNVACNKQPNRVKNEMEIINRQKTDLNQQKLFQMFDLIYAGLISFLCNVILYRIIEIFTTACKIDPD